MTLYAAMQTGQSAVLCDLRSDTVTRPHAAMRKAMAEAEVGDDVYREDPTVTALEHAVADRLGKEAGLFVTSGTQSNLCALLAHCGRGEEILTGIGYHVFQDEARGSSVLGGIALHPLPLAGDAGLEAADITAAVKPDDSHCPITRLLSLENTVGGRAVPLARIAAAVAAARAAGLSTHLDGARFFNAITALGCAPGDLAGPFDTVSVCLSKGLGAPAGSVLVGPAEPIARARRWRKMLGGGLRQSGVLAAAGLLALEQGSRRLGEDHARAERLAMELEQMSAGAVRQATNMVFLTPRDGDCDGLRAHMVGHGVVIGGQAPEIRMVLHRDVSDAALETALAAFRSHFAA